MRYEALRLLCFLICQWNPRMKKESIVIFVKKLISNGFEMLQFRSIIALVLIEVLQINFIRS